MTNRRAFMHAAALAALAPMLPLRAETEPRLWPRYRDAVAIDGEAGLDLLRADDTDAKTVERELAEARASGLTAVLLQVTGVHAGFEEAVNDLMRCRARADARWFLLQDLEPVLWFVARLAGEHRALAAR